MRKYTPIGPWITLSEMWYTTSMLVTVDTGGTKTLIASFKRNGTIADTLTFPTPKNSDDYVATLRRILQERYGSEQVDMVVVALPGIVKDGIALWCNNLGWKNFDAQTAFSRVLGDTPIRFENDANLAGLSEARAIEPTPVSALYVTISTGIGTGVITNGTIDPGLRHSEGGRALVEFDGIVREWESFASGKAIHTTYGKYARDITDVRVWRQVADRISRGFLAVIPLMQPEVIIIGGSMGTYFSQYGPQLTALLREKLPAHIACPAIIQATNPEQAVIYGAYYYAVDALAA